MIDKSMGGVDTADQKKEAYGIDLRSPVSFT